MDIGASATGLSDEPELKTVVDRYETWRRRWVSLTGREPSRDLPELSDGRLWFRDGFPHPDWTARIIESAPYGYVVLDSTTERRISPDITVRAIFSRFEDAGKYIIAQAGDMLRRECKLEPRYREWHRFGLSDKLQKSDSDPTAVGFIADYNGIAPDTVQQLIHKYSVKTQPNRCAHLASSDEPYSRILTLSFDELDATLTDGLVANT